MTRRWINFKCAEWSQIEIDGRQTRQRVRILIAARLLFSRPFLKCKKKSTRKLAMGKESRTGGWIYMRCSLTHTIDSSLSNEARQKKCHKPNPSTHFKAASTYKKYILRRIRWRDAIKTVKMSVWKSKREKRKILYCVSANHALQCSAVQIWSARKCECTHTLAHVPQLIDMSCTYSRSSLAAPFVPIVVLWFIVSLNVEHTHTHTVNSVRGAVLFFSFHFIVALTISLPIIYCSFVIKFFSPPKCANNKVNMYTENRTREKYRI